MHHEPAPEDIPGAIAEVKAEVMAGLIVRVILRVAVGVDDPGPPPDLNLAGG